MEHQIMAGGSLEGDLVRSSKRTPGGRKNAASRRLRPPRQQPIQASTCNGEWGPVSSSELPMRSRSARRLGSLRLPGGPPSAPSPSSSTTTATIAARSPRQPLQETAPAALEL